MEIGPKKEWGGKKVKPNRYMAYSRSDAMDASPDDKKGRLAEVQMNPDEPRQVLVIRRKLILDDSEDEMHPLLAKERLDHRNKSAAKSNRRRLVKMAQKDGVAGKDGNSNMGMKARSSSASISHHEHNMLTAVGSRGGSGRRKPTSPAGPSSREGRAGSR
ncbi:unnamed protein product [Linum trigynum]|uniref:Uncharacterized protein n=1 Tax=Linum trigynum TaxID=586398 RepID=A0AAV2FAM9_9ROSI